MKRTLVWILCLAAMLLTGCADPSDETRMLSVNVGKADAHLIETDGQFFLIDTGSVQSWAQLRRTLEREGVGRLEAVFLTHTDKDHAGGLSLIAQSDVEVGTWYASRYCAQYDEEEHPAVVAAAMRDQTVTWLSAGDSADFGEVRFDAVAPSQYDENENDDSLVLLTKCDAGRMLLTGDMRYPEETRLLSSVVDIRADVLKVAYHGIAESTSAEFVKRVSPKIAVISTNSAVREDTPAETVLDALSQAGCAVWQTQYATGGVLTTLQKGEAPAAEYYALDPPKEAAADVSIAKVDARDDAIWIACGQDVDLTGWVVFSEKGDEAYAFPDGASANAGQTIVLGTESTPFSCDYLWKAKNVIHNKKSDPITLYDSFGRVISTHP